MKMKALLSHQTTRDSIWRRSVVTIPFLVLVRQPSLRSHAILGEERAKLEAKVSSTCSLSWRRNAKNSKERHRLRSMWIRTKSQPPRFKILPKLTLSSNSNKSKKKCRTLKPKRQNCKLTPPSFCFIFDSKLFKS